MKAKLAEYKGKFWYVDHNYRNHLVAIKDTSLGISTGGRHVTLTGERDAIVRGAIKYAVKNGELPAYTEL